MNNNEVLDHNGNEIEIGAFHSGEFLQEEIEARHILKKDIAKALEILPHHLSEIFAGKRNISARLAVKLEKILGSRPSLRLRRKEGSCNYFLFRTFIVYCH